MRDFRVISIALLVVLLLLGVARADDLPYPPGRTIQRFEEHKFAIMVPEGLSADAPASLVVVLHGPAGRATQMTDILEPWVQDGYVICAPKAADMTWEHVDLKRVLRLAAHLKEVLPIDAAKVHVVGYSHRGSELGLLAFDDELRPCSATWVAAGFRGRQIPKWAKQDLGVIAIAGSDDKEIKGVRGTAKALRGKVRTVEVREQPGLGHGFPYKLLPYLRWWMGVQEGRIEPGDDRFFDWQEDPDSAKPSQHGTKKGGLVIWVYDASDTGKPDARVLQRDVFFDPDIRFLAGQLPCLKLDKAKHDAAVQKLGIETTPALVVLDRNGDVVHAYEAPFNVKHIRKTLRGVAPRKSRR